MFKVRLYDEMIRSMVNDFPDDGLNLVQRSFGVMTVASGSSIIMAKLDLPAIFSVLLDSHRLW